MSVANAPISVVPLYDFLRAISLNQPPNVYPTLVGFAKVLFVPYVFSKVSLTPLGSAPPLVLYLI